MQSTLYCIGANQRTDNSRSTIHYDSTFHSSGKHCCNGLLLQLRLASVVVECITWHRRWRQEYATTVQQKHWFVEWKYNYYRLVAIKRTQIVGTGHKVVTDCLKMRLNHFVSIHHLRWTIFSLCGLDGFVALFGFMSELHVVSLEIFIKKSCKWTVHARLNFWRKTKSSDLGLKDIFTVYRPHRNSFNYISLSNSRQFPLPALSLFLTTFHKFQMIHPPASNAAMLDSCCWKALKAYCGQ